MYHKLILYSANRIQILFFLNVEKLVREGRLKEETSNGRRKPYQWEKETPDRRMKLPDMFQSNPIPMKETESNQSSTWCNKWL